MCDINPRLAAAMVEDLRRHPAPPAGFWHRLIVGIADLITFSPRRTEA
jgi:hypothetical protein